MSKIEIIKITVFVKNKNYAKKIKLFVKKIKFFVKIFDSKIQFSVKHKNDENTKKINGSNGVRTHDLSRVKRT